MATTLGPDVMADPSLGDGFDRRPPPRHLLLASHPDNTSSALSPLPSPLPSPRGNAPPPNPPFVFPARPSSASAPSSYSRATGRRPRSAVEGQEREFGLSSLGDDTRKPTSPALPDFSFNPGAGLAPAAEHAFLSPPQSPQSPRAIPSRPTNHGHRRGGSEFVGGNLRAGEVITVMSTSPTKSESGFASPKLSPMDGPKRKGHGHRRSTAISNHDLSKILQPTSPNPVRGGSAPASPASLEPTSQYSFPDISVQVSESAVPNSSSDEELKDEAESSGASSPLEVPQTQRAKPIPRARVGFSDTLEFIPRPLSLVSNETSSTATARPGHSVSGSISSIISANSTGPEREAVSPIRPSSPRRRAESRPSTAGAILDRTLSQQDSDPTDVSSPRRRNSIPILSPLPDPEPCEPAALSPTRMPKKWSFWGLEPFSGTSSPTRSRPVSSGSSELPTHPTALSPSSSIPDQVLPTETVEQDASCQKSVPRKRSKKHKKVKVWTPSILTRKSKQRHHKHRPGSRRAPTPPPRRHSEIDDADDVLADIAPSSMMPTLLVTETTEGSGEVESWQTPKPVMVPDEDTPYPMIDLDAALGPFNTPLPRDPEWEAAQRAGGLMKRPMHSAAGMSRFTGPGMHYQHRRAESAPEMVPFEAGRLGFPRFNSTSTMADVFEEDEEEEDSAQSKKAGAASTVVDSTSDQESDVSSVNDSSLSNVKKDEEIAALPHGIKRKGSGLSEEDGSQARLLMKAEPSSNSLQEDVIMEEPHGLGVPGTTPFAHTAPESSESSTPSPRQVHQRRELAPVEVSPLHLPTPSLAPVSPYSIAHSSSAFPSPRSPMSYDGNRVSTAPSSITEDNFQSLLMGEPGPEVVRISVDDIPSLTSSNSTMTRDSLAAAQHSQLRYPAFADQPRPASLTSAAFGRRRSSLASLSRLISSSHGERSKLSVEMSLESEQEKKPKVSRTKRLSRMMQFWKPRENNDT